MTTHFTMEELSCKHCGQMQFSEDDLSALEALRSSFDRPMPLSSGYRCPTHNSAVSGTGIAGPHTIFAVDVRIFGEPAFRLIEVAMKLGWTGIGIQQKGSMGSRYIHLDRLPAGGINHPRPRIWSY